MKPKTIRRILIIFSILCILSLYYAIFITTSARADDKEYLICVHTCYLDLPKLEPCIEQEKKYWEPINVSDKQFEKTCKRIISGEKIECQVNCVVEQIKFVDRAVEYYNKEVKNFPNSNQ